MPNFNFEAVDENNKIISGQRVASSEAEIASWLKLKKYTIVNIEIQNTPSQAQGSSWNIFNQISLSDRANFARNLSTMIKSGLPIAEAIGVIADDNKSKRFKEILNDIKYDIESGKPLSKAIAKYPDIFDKTYVSLVASGEMSGKIAEVLESIYKHLAKEVNLRNKLISAFTYPVVVMGALVMMGIIMLIVVVPKILEVFTRMKIKLPFALKVLQFLSLIFIKFWFITIPILIVIILLIVVFFRSKSAQKARSKLLNSLPFFSKLSKNYDMARLTSTLALLMRSGVPINDALKITSDGIIDEKLHDAIIKAEVKVKEGKPLSEALGESPKEIPVMLIKITKVGEKSGKMDQVMLEISEYYDEQVNLLIKTMSDMVEPVLMLIVGLIVAALVLSIISPIYGLVGSFSNR